LWLDERETVLPELPYFSTCMNSFDLEALVCADPDDILELEE
jgi:hypothetical protein